MFPTCLNNYDTTFLKHTKVAGSYIFHLPSFDNTNNFMIEWPCSSDFEREGACFVAEGIYRLEQLLGLGKLIFF